MELYVVYVDSDVIEDKYLLCMNRSCLPSFAFFLFNKCIFSFFDTVVDIEVHELST